MITITAILEVKEGQEEIMRKGLLDVAKNVAENEPNTLSFFISQDLEDTTIFTVYERFKDGESMDTHNNSEVVSKFYETIKPILEKETLITANEIYRLNKIKD